MGRYEEIWGDIARPSTSASSRFSMPSSSHILLATSHATRMSLVRVRVRARARARFGVRA